MTVNQPASAPPKQPRRGRPRVLGPSPKSQVGPLIDRFLRAGGTWEELAALVGAPVKTLRNWYARGERGAVAAYFRTWTKLRAHAAGRSPSLPPPPPPDREPEVLGPGDVF